MDSTLVYRCLWCRSEKQSICLLKTEMFRQKPLAECGYIRLVPAIITPITISYIRQHIFSTVKGENGSNGERKMQSWCQTSTRLTTYRSSLRVRARPCHLTFPLSPVLPTLLATRYWFFIPLNISLPLIEFTPDYQCFREASPPLPALPGSSHP